MCGCFKLRERVLLSLVLCGASMVSGILIAPAVGGFARGVSAAQTARKRSAAGAADARASSADSSRGAFLFLRDCAPCHGKTGDGNSRVRRTLHPKPLDVTNFVMTDSFILDVLHQGVPGSDMPAWHSSPENDLDQVAAYTERLAHPDELSEQDQYAAPAALEEAGRRVYQSHCTRCHGANGNGDGPDARRYLPKPPSFAGMRPSFAAAQSVIENGVAGTAMASWPLLTPPEIQAVTQYIRSFYNEPAAGRSATPTPRSTEGDGP